MDLKEVRWGVMDQINLAQERPVMGSCEHGNENSGSIKCFEIPEQMRNCGYSRTQLHVLGW
jgi:hypothetical protein